MAESQEPLLRALRELLGASALLEGNAAKSVYARDASHLTWGRPLAVALPEREDQVGRIVALCASAGVPVVARGAGTGLSGGAVPAPGALVLSLARLTGLGVVDVEARIVRAQPGVLNSALSLHAAPHGLHFAPDPSSQAASTIGGNIAENAGGPHCLRLGVTGHHLRSLDWCDARGRSWTTGAAVSVTRGPDLRGLLCGSEGTLGLVTGAWLQLTPVATEVETLWAAFPALDEATAAVQTLLRAGLLPVAIEIIDQAMVLTVEEAFGFGLPTDVEAVMIAELAGVGGTVADQAASATALLERAGARTVRRAVDAGERAALWQCRKRAFGAVGRLSPNYVSMDIVVPLGELSGLVREIGQVRAEFGVKIATAFHAGDGNLHPAVHYDERRPGDLQRAHAAADAIIRAALSRGGSVTGEHGVGLEKKHALPWQLDAVTAELLRNIKRTFDPADTLNPGKALPDSEPAAPAFAPRPPSPPVPAFRWDCLTVSTPVSTPLSVLQEQALARGLWLPLGLSGTGSGWGLDAQVTVGQAIDRLLTGPSLLARATARDLLLEVWAETGDGRLFHAGAPVFKNVAGYDLPRLLCGADGRLARLVAATLQLRPAPTAASAWRLERSGTGPVPDAARTELLASVSRCGDALAGSQVIIDRDAHADWNSVLVFAAGFRAPAEGELGTALQRLATAAGMNVVAVESRPFPQALALAVAVGTHDWALRADDWTIWQPLPGCGITALPAGPRRLIWQEAPRLVWSADGEPAQGVSQAPASWHSDRIVTRGTWQPLPGPVRGEPTAILRGLKQCFDPAGTLGGPGWLTGVDDG